MDTGPARRSCGRVPVGGAIVRGRQTHQVTMLAFLDPETRVPPDYPPRTVRRLAEAALADLSPPFDRMDAETGRPSIPPERLLKASLLIALCSVRSERAFCEELDYTDVARCQGGGVPIGDAVGQHVPHRDQELAGDGDDRLAFPDPGREPREGGPPVGVA